MSEDKVCENPESIQTPYKEDYSNARCVIVPLHVADKDSLELLNKLLKLQEEFDVTLETLMTIVVDKLGLRTKV